VAGVGNIEIAGRVHSSPGWHAQLGAGGRAIIAAGAYRSIASRDGQAPRYRVQSEDCVLIREKKVALPVDRD
jgi:hypothetical protein